MVSFKFKQGFVIVGMSMYATSSAFGTIDNTVTVTGTGPNGGVSANATASVDVVDAISELTITKSYEFKPEYANADGVADEGEIITYIFQVKNTGNVTITDVEVNEGAFEGTSGVPVVPNNPVIATEVDDEEPKDDSTDLVNPSDDKWGILAPGDTVTFTGDYTIVQTDIDQLQN